MPIYPYASLNSSPHTHTHIFSRQPQSINLWVGRWIGWQDWMDGSSHRTNQTHHTLILTTKLIHTTLLLVVALYIYTQGFLTSSYILTLTYSICMCAYYLSSGNSFLPCLETPNSSKLVPGCPALHPTSWELVQGSVYLSCGTLRVNENASKTSFSRGKLAVCVCVCVWMMNEFRDREREDLRVCVCVYVCEVIRNSCHCMQRLRKGFTGCGHYY